MKLAKDIISDVPCISKGEFATKARQILRDDIYREIYVVDAHKKPVGYIDITDVLKVEGTRSNVTIDGFMKDAPVASMNDTLEDVAKKIRGPETDSCAITKDDGTYAGAVLLSDLFPVLAGRDSIPGIAADVMTAKVVTASPDESIQKVYSMIVENGYAGIPIVKKKELVGIISRRDLLSGQVRTSLHNGAALPVEKIMQTDVITIQKNDTLAKAAKLMVESNIGRIPVVERKKIIGIVDRFDLLKIIL